ncbi:MAG: SDR family oxidoreductase [Syntrophaceae bacterium]|nr:SDR family oxidoreductase [Syntrophaceae bacterium]
MRLNNKVVIVTGASRGIGRAIAVRCAKEGAKLVVCDILDCDETAAEARALGADVLEARTDVSSEEDTQKLAQTAIECFGHIDVLINNAAIFGAAEDQESVKNKGFIKPIEEIRVEDWDRVMAVNVKGVFLCSRAVIPHFKSRKAGKIVNIASATAFIGLANAAHYTTSKGAIITLTKVLARALGDFSINVNAVAPGMVWTEAVLATYSDDEVRDTVRRQLIKRPVLPEDVANVAVFLASEESDAVTGAVHVVNAGEFMY